MTDDDETVIIRLAATATLRAEPGLAEVVARVPGPVFAVVEEAISMT